MKIIGEIISLVSSLMEAYERGQKTYKKSLTIGIIRYVVQAAAYIFLGGVSGLIITIMAIIRSFLMYYKKFSGWIVAAWISISFVINIYFISCIADIFPFIGTLQFTLMAKKQNVLWLKYAQIINSLIWSFYHIYLHSYIYLIFDVILITIGIVRIKKGVTDEIADRK